MLGRIFTKEYMYIEKNIFPKKHVARKALTCVEESSGTYASCYLTSVKFWAVFGINKSVKKCLLYNIMGILNLMSKRAWPIFGPHMYTMAEQ